MKAKIEFENKSKQKHSRQSSDNSKTYLNKLKQAEAMENALVNRKIDSTERFENIINNHD